MSSSNPPQTSETAILPDGSTVEVINAYEASFVIKEIFEQNAYPLEDLSVPAEPVIIDVGANIGIFVRFAISHFPGARIFAFEPAPQVYDLLAKNTAAFGSQVTAERCGISDAAGEAEFTYYPNYSLLSGFKAVSDEDEMLLRSGIGTELSANPRLAGRVTERHISALTIGKLDGAMTIRCPLQTLSHFIDRHSLTRVDFLKVDAERCELPILRGILESHWSLIQCVCMELHESSAADSRSTPRRFSKYSPSTALKFHSNRAATATPEPYFFMQNAPLSQIVRDRINPESKLALLLESLEQDYSIFIPSVQDSFNSNPSFFCELGEEICVGLLAKFPLLSVNEFCLYYADFTIEQNRHQRAYVRTGIYCCGSHEEANKEVYQNDERMRSYMIVTILTQFLWPHHLAIFKFFLGEFAKAHADGVKTVIEFAPGHGFFGRKALEAWPDATLTGIDISSEAVEISRGMAAATAVAARTRYLTGNALDWQGGQADRVIAGELLEHLDQPQMLMDSVLKTLVPGGYAFVTAALTAAHMDHVTEFKTCQEVFDMAGKAGLEVKCFHEAAPLVVPKGTDKIPRVLAMVLHRPVVS